MFPHPGKLLCLLALAGPLMAQDEAARLHDPDPEVRSRAARRLGEIGAVSALPALIDAAFDPASEVVEAAIDALRTIGPPARAAVPWLEELLLVEPWQRARIDRTIRTLGRPDREVPALNRWLSKRDLLAKKVDTLDGIGRDKVKALLAALRDGDARVQGQAALVLGLKAAYLKGVAEALLPLRGHESAYVRGNVFRALVKDGDVAGKVFAQELSHEDPGTRRLAALALLHMGGRARVAMPALVRAVGDGDPLVRYRVVVSIGKQRKAPKEAVEALIGVLEEKDSKLVSAAVNALLQLGRDAAPAVPALAALIESDDYRVRSAVCGALAQIGPGAAAATPALVQACYDEVWDVVTAALRALERIGPGAAAAAPFVAEFAEANRFGAGVASQALRVLGAGKSLPPQPKAEELPLLIDQLEDGSPEVAGKAAFAIGRLAPRDQKSCAALIQAMKRKTPYVRRHASLALQRIGPACAPFLMEVLEKGDTIQRRLAADVLWQLAREVGVAALPAWQRALADSDARVRGHACGAIGVVGPAARAAIPGLVAALRDEEIAVAQSAAWALGNMKGAASGTVGDLTAVLLEREGQGLEWMILGALGGFGAASNPAVPTIREMVRRQPNLAQPAIDALARIGPAGHAALVEIIRDERGFARQMALQKILDTRSDPPGLRAALERAVQDSDLRVRQLALRALQHKKLDGPMSIEALVASLQREQLRAIRHSGVPGTLATQAKTSELFELTVHPDARVRWAALRALCLKDPEQFSSADRDRIHELVRARFTDKEVMVRNLAGALLLHVPPAEVTPDWIRRAGTTTDQNARRAIGAALAKVGASGVPALDRALRGNDRAMRTGAASVVTALGPIAKRTAPALCRAVLANDEDARAYAHALTSIGSDALGAWITTYPGVKDRSARTLLSQAIVQQGAAAVPFLEELRKKGADSTRMWSVSMLSRIGEPALDSLCAAAADPNAAIARFAIEGLGRIHVQDARIVNVLVGALSRRDLRSVAASALRAQGDGAFPHLKKAAGDDDPGRRAGAYSALGFHGERAVPLLRRGIVDVDPEAREAAVRAAGSLQAALAPELIGALRDKDARVRIMAAYSLARIKPVPRTALPELLRMFRVGSRNERRATHRGLVALKAAPSIAPLLAEEDRNLRSAAASLLLEMRGDAVPSVTALIRSHGDPARRKGVAVLARIGAQDDLLRMLRDEDPGVRAAVAHGLGAMRARARGAVPDLVKALDDPDPAVRKEALWAIGEIGPAATDAIPALRARIRKGEDEARENAIAMLARVGARDDLAKLLLHSDPAVRAAAARGLGSMGAKARDAVPALVALLEDPDRKVVRDALQALGWIGPAAQSAVPALLTWIRARKDSSGRSAVEVLVRIGASDALVELLREEDAGVRASAARGLGRMRTKPPAAVPALIEALNDSDGAVSKAAVRALGDFGPGAKAAIPALRALHGKGRHVMLIEAALAKIHGGR